MEIYALTENGQTTELFAKLEGVAEWIQAQKPVGGMRSYDAETAGDYAITADNLDKLLKAAKANGCAALIWIQQDFFVTTVKTRYTLTTLTVH